MKLEKFSFFLFLNLNLDNFCLFNRNPWGSSGDFEKSVPKD